MPFYEYQCSHCGHLFEAMQKISEAPLRKCPECGKNMLKKLLSAPVFRLKGSGWYETDFKSDKERKRNLAGADQESSDTAGAADKAKTGTEATGKAEATGKTEVAGKTEAKPQAAQATDSGQNAPAAKPTAGSHSASTSSTAKRAATRTVAPRPAKRTPPAAKRARSKSSRARPARGRR